ncbi:MAG TPA: hypothetical protein VM597_00395, partial [Gemmataceae bacterium]|nr:hypothetical protein [Gemmataceae bacterium]
MSFGTDGVGVGSASGIGGPAGTGVAPGRAGVDRSAPPALDPSPVGSASHGPTTADSPSTPPGGGKPGDGARAAPDAGPARRGDGQPDGAPGRGRSGSREIGFRDGLDGWTIDIAGGSPHGKGNVRHGSAILTEGDSFLVGLHREFVVPEGPVPLVFRYTELDFDTSSQDAAPPDQKPVNDAFEASVVDAEGRPLVHPFAAGRDAFFNATEGAGLVLGPGAGETGDAIKTVTLDLTGVAPGTAAAVHFRLVNNDKDTETSVRILDVIVPGTNEAPSVSAAPAAAAAQYSDPVGPVAVTASDDSEGPLTTELSHSVGGGPFTPGLPAGMTLTGSGTDGLGAWTLAGTADLAPGAYAVRVAVRDAEGEAGTVDVPVTVTREDARATYSGVLFASTSSSSDPDAVVTLRATVRDLTAVDPSADPNAGDVRHATVSFVNRDTGAVIASGLPVTLLDPADPKSGVVSYDWTVDLGSANSRSVTVGVVVDGRYARNNSADDAVVTVSRPLDLFVTGGGYLVNERSAGTYAGDAGGRTNLGFNVKFNKQLTNLQGQVTLILRRGGQVYQVKTNALSSLAAPAGAGVATLVGKANLKDVTDPANPVMVAGNLTLELTVTDRGEPGTADAVGLTLWRQSELLFSSRWTGAKTAEQVLAGGNVVVHSGGKPLHLGGAAPAVGGEVAPLTAAALAPVADAAVSRWVAAGVGPDAVATLRGVEVRLADLPDGMLGLAGDRVVWLDRDAAGQGWYADPTPHTDEEFTPAADGHGLGAVGGTGADVGLDLLTVVGHELGHVLGLPDLDPDEHLGELMAGSLRPGVRQLPRQHEAHAALPEADGHVVVRAAAADGAVLAGEALSLEASAPVDQAPAGTPVLITGRAAAEPGPSGAVPPLLAVTVNGRPVDAVDPAGNFFTRVQAAPGRNTFALAAADAGGGTATTAVTITGTQPPAGPLDFSAVADLSGGVGAEYGRTSYHVDSKVLYADVAVRNDGRYAAGAPLLVGVKNVSDPAVRVRGADGVTPDGVPY